MPKAMKGTIPSNDCFQLMWTAFRLVYPLHAKGFEGVKTCNRIGEELEALSVSTPEDGDPGQRLQNPYKIPADLILDLSEYTMFKKMMLDENMNWPWEKAKTAEEMLSWVQDGWTEVDVGETDKD